MGWKKEQRKSKQHKENRDMGVNEHRLTIEWEMLGERVNEGQIKKQWDCVVWGPVEATDHSNYPLFSSNMAEALRVSPLGHNQLLIFSEIQFRSIFLCLLHIKHFLQLFLWRSYLYYLTPLPIQSDSSFRPTLVWLESIPGSFQDRHREWVCVCVVVRAQCVHSCLLSMIEDKKESEIGESRRRVI